MGQPTPHLMSTRRINNIVQHVIATSTYCVVETLVPHPHPSTGKMSIRPPKQYCLQCQNICILRSSCPCSIFEGGMPGPLLIYSTYTVLSFNDDKRHKHTHICAYVPYICCHQTCTQRKPPLAQCSDREGDGTGQEEKRRLKAVTLDESSPMPPPLYRSVSEAE